MPMTKEHLRCHRHATGRKLPVVEGQGHYSAPPPLTPRMGDIRPLKGLQTQEWPPHHKVSQPAAAQDGRVFDRKLQHTNDIAQGMAEHSSSHARGTNFEGATTITKDATLAPKGLVFRHSGAPCTTLIFCDVFGCQATSPNTTAKLTPAFGWRITTSHVEWEGQTMIYSSSSSSQSIWLTPLEPG
jgi:hypothetical protein